MLRSAGRSFAFTVTWLTASAAAPRLPAETSPPRSTVERSAIETRFSTDTQAQRIALDLYDATGDQVDVLPAERMDGGYRGLISLVPALPVDATRKHLAWVAGALHDFDVFFAAITEHGTPRYRWRGLDLRFFRSVGDTTPNAFALGWRVAYNVNGSIDTSADRVRETLFHEIFHLDDADHDDWSPRHLTAIQDAIERKCGQRTACLAPYAPTATIVRRGTYYAFQTGNDVHEYAAEVALRWYTEQRAIVHGETPVRPSFKCGPPENRQAWEAIAGEFFGRVDLVPGC
ncbi:MAG TPA: hypothetical protein VH044_16655 [Polyangiaceae bacterium]|jgi:hypothetical protein|nr:hypothetical protein [Polyangiaceae bacterium]